MQDAKTVTFYLDPGMLESARAGQHNFLEKLASVMRAAGLSVDYAENSAVARILSQTQPGYALFHMVDPTHARALTVRRNYYYPFWQIAASAQRWEWPVAHADFATAEIDRAEATRFTRFWAKRLYENAPATARGTGMIYVPLQGLLGDHRSFQTCSPLDMVRAVLARFPDRRVLITLHPNEVYSPADLAKLRGLVAGHPSAEIATGGMEKALQTCDFVVTQNSSAAFAGFFFGKPAVLFAKIDFHHICANVADLGVDAAFDAVENLKPDFEGYIWWFLQQQSINAGKPDAEDKIAGMLRKYGWPI